jgi:hypothetical protein
MPSLTAGAEKEEGLVLMLIRRQFPRNLFDLNEESTRTHALVLFIWLLPRLHGSARL